MRELSNHAVLSMSGSTMAVSSKYTQDLSVKIIFFTFSCKWFLCLYFWAVIWSYIVNLFAALYELASASARTLLKLASSVRALLKPNGDTLSQFCGPIGSLPSSANAGNSKINSRLTFRRQLAVAAPSPLPAIPYLSLRKQPSFSAPGPSGVSREGQSGRERRRTG